MLGTSSGNTAWKYAMVVVVSTLWAAGAFDPARVVAGDYGEKFEDYPVDAGYEHASPEALEAWRDRKYGMRIPWGVYSMLNVEASWPLTGFRVGGDVSQFRAKYQELYKNFNPTDFSGERWAELMQRCGFKYFTFVTKHHDGFAMWDTKTKVKKRFIQSGPRAGKIEDCDLHYSIMEAPFGRDILKELIDATSKRGISTGLYFSHVDWYDADFRLDRWNPHRDGNYSKQTDPEGWRRFVARHRRQVRELLTRYGKVDQFEWDLCFPESAWPDVVETVKMARNLQPGVLMRDRGIGMYGDIMTPEMWIPKVNPDDVRAGGLGQVVDKPWQVIFNMAGHAAYDPHAEHYKSAEWVLTSLIDIVAKGGNFMPMLGADAKGNFHPVAVERLERVGRWLAVNGEAIFKTRPYRSWHDGDHVRYTRGKDWRTVYAISLKWPGRELKLRKVRAREGSQIRMLGCEEPLVWRQDQYGLSIEIPESLQDAVNRPCEMAYAFKIEQQGGGHPPVMTQAPRVEVERWAVEPLVAISTGTPGVEIRYTLDGRDPDGEGLLYEKPFRVKKGSIVKAAVFARNMLPSSVVHATVSGGAAINFQPAGGHVPDGWFIDCGKPFGERGHGLSYGWNADASQAMRRRQVDPDPVCDTFCTLYKAKVWELSVPNGKYLVTIGLGDSRGGSRNTVDVEGVSFCNDLLLGTPGTEGAKTDPSRPAVARGTEISKVVAIDDGRLTVFGGSTPPDTKIRFVKVVPADPSADAEKPSAGQPEATAIPGYVPGLEYRYYEGAWEIMPTAIVSVPFKKGTTAKFDLSAADRKVGYAFDFRGSIRIDREGDYTFYLTSDAGSRLVIGGTTAVDNDCGNIRFGFPSPHEAKGVVALKKGLHPVHLIFYTDRFTPEPFLQVEYEGPGIARREVPAEVLNHSQSISPEATAANPPRKETGNILALALRTQRLAKDDKGMSYWKVVETPVQWRADETMLIIIDMWNKHWCANGCETPREMLPRFNDVVKHARDLGVQIIHSPTEPAMGPYYSHPAFKYMATFPKAPLPPAIPHDEFPMPLNVADQAANGPIVEVGGKAAGYAQLKEIDIVFEENGAKDGICEPFEPVWNMMRAKGIKNVIITGCATNMCVMGKPLGIRNMVARGVNVVLVRDMTRPMYNPASPPYVNMPEATRMMTEYIEKFWCPTIGSEEILKSKSAK